uniref:RING-type E3 ubiquitin transferase n=1 Tax=Syphacia muris TaxID=451379 RepID=A0A0N5AA82_9BILA
MDTSNEGNSGKGPNVFCLPIIKVESESSLMSKSAFQGEQGTCSTAVIATHENDLQGSSTSSSTDSQLNKVGTNAVKDGEQCPICFLDIVDETRTDVCKHRFCFYCVSEWIKNKAECCICKQPVRKLLHNFRMDPYTGKEVYDVALADDIQTVGKLEALRKNLLSQRLDCERAEVKLLLRRLRRNNREIEDDFLKESRGNFSSLGRESLERRRSRNIDLINRLSVLLDDWDRPRGEIVADPAFRIVVYERTLFRVPVVLEIETRQVVKPSFFESESKTQMLRLLPFIQREIVAMMSPIQLSERDLNSICNKVYWLMKTYQVNDPKFTVTLANELLCQRARVDHFAQLLFEFASSMQSLELFDENSSYINPSENSRRRGYFMGRDDSSVDDIEVEFESHPNQSHSSLQNLPLNRVSHHVDLMFRDIAYPLCSQNTLNVRNRLRRILTSGSEFDDTPSPSSSGVQEVILDGRGSGDGSMALVEVGDIGSLLSSRRETRDASVSQGHIASKSEPKQICSSSQGFYTNKDAIYQKQKRLFDNVFKDFVSHSYQPAKKGKDDVVSFRNRSTSGSTDEEIYMHRSCLLTSHPSSTISSLIDQVPLNDFSTTSLSDDDFVKIPGRKTITMKSLKMKLFLFLIVDNKSNSEAMDVLSDGGSDVEVIQVLPPKPLRDWPVITLDESSSAKKTASSVDATHHSHQRTNNNCGRINDNGRNVNSSHKSSRSRQFLPECRLRESSHKSEGKYIKRKRTKSLSPTIPSKKENNTLQRRPSFDSHILRDHEHNITDITGSVLLSDQSSESAGSLEPSRLLQLRERRLIHAMKVIEDAKKALEKDNRILNVNRVIKHARRATKSLQFIERICEAKS